MRAIQNAACPREHGSKKEGACLSSVVTPALKQAIVKSDEIFKQKGTQSMDALIMQDMVNNYDEHVLGGRIIEHVSQDGTTKMAAWKTEEQGDRSSVTTTKRAKKEDFASDESWVMVCSQLSSEAHGWTKFAMLDDADLDPMPPVEDTNAMLKHTMARVQEAYDQITRVTMSVRSSGSKLPSWQHDAHTFPAHVHFVVMNYIIFKRKLGRISTSYRHYININHFHPPTQLA